MKAKKQKTEQNHNNTNNQMKEEMRREKKKREKNASTKMQHSRFILTLCIYSESYMLGMLFALAVHCNARSQDVERRFRNDGQRMA